MKLVTLIIANAILFVAFGIAFALYGPLMLAFYRVPELSINMTDYWHIASFARMFGAALFSLGLLLWAVSRFVGTLSPAHRRGVIFALLLSNLLAAIVSLTQQTSIWGTPAGWVTSAVFIILTLAYGYSLALEQKGVSPAP
jgi:hypothetical protein